MIADAVSRTPIDIDALAGQDKNVFDWLTTRFGAPPTGFWRQLRWRIGWEAEVEIDGCRQEVLVRGARGKDHRSPMSMLQEGQAQEIMERYGVPAPHVYGMIDEPLALVMEKLPGGINSELIQDPEVRRSVRRQFIDALAKLHAIPGEEFRAIGMPIPETARDLTLNLYRPCFDIVRDWLAGRPFPLVAFFEKWLEANAPEGHARAAFVTADAGQFLYQGDRLTGLIDFEVSYIGDPAAEFAGMRLRDTTEPLGEIADLRAYYESITGYRISRKAIAYHSAGFASTNSMLMWPMMFKPEAENDFVAYLQFCVATSRWGIQGISESLDMTLDPVPEPEANPTITFAAPDQLQNLLEGWSTTDSALRFHLEGAATLARYLGRCHVYGASVLAADLADAQALTGEEVRTRDEADAAVDQWVRAAKPESDVTLVRFFHRWLSRQNFLLKGCGSQAYLTEASLQPIRGD
jgi:aminoglycoside phosphotransferase (APT) family kinase protein